MKKAFTAVILTCIFSSICFRTISQTVINIEGNTALKQININKDSKEFLLDKLDSILIITFPNVSDIRDYGIQLNNDKSKFILSSNCTGKDNCLQISGKDLEHMNLRLNFQNGMLIGIGANGTTNYRGINPGKKVDTTNLYIKIITPSKTEDIDKGDNKLTLSQFSDTVN
jgi:hypothetical protein